MDSGSATNEAELTSTMGNVLSTSTKEEKSDTSDAIPTSSTDASKTASAPHLASDDPISSTSSEVDQTKMPASEVATVDEKGNMDEDILEMNISTLPNEKITEDVEDLVHDLESLLEGSEVTERQSSHDNSADVSVFGELDMAVQESLFSENPSFVQPKSATKLNDKELFVSEDIEQVEDSLEQKKAIPCGVGDTHTLHNTEDDSNTILSAEEILMKTETEEGGITSNNIIETSCSDSKLTQEIVVKEQMNTDLDVPDDAKLTTAFVSDVDADVALTDGTKLQCEGKSICANSSINVSETASNTETKVHNMQGESVSNEITVYSKASTQLETIQQEEDNQMLSKTDNMTISEGQSTPSEEKDRDVEVLEAESELCGVIDNESEEIECAPVTDHEVPTGSNKNQQADDNQLQKEVFENSIEADPSCKEEECKNTMPFVEQNDTGTGPKFENNEKNKSALEDEINVDSSQKDSPAELEVDVKADAEENDEVKQQVDNEVNPNQLLTTSEVNVNSGIENNEDPAPGEAMTLFQGQDKEAEPKKNTETLEDAIEDVENIDKEQTVEHQDEEHIIFGQPDQTGQEHIVDEISTLIESEITTAGKEACDNITAVNNRDQTCVHQAFSSEEPIVSTHEKVLVNPFNALIESKSEVQCVETDIKAIDNAVASKEHVEAEETIKSASDEDKKLTKKEVMAANMDILQNTYPNALEDVDHDVEKPDLEVQGLHKIPEEDVLQHYSSDVIPTEVSEEQSTAEEAEQKESDQVLHMDHSKTGCYKDNSKSETFEFSHRIEDKNRSGLEDIKSHGFEDCKMETIDASSRNDIEPDLENQPMEKEIIDGGSDCSKNIKNHSFEDMSKMVDLQKDVLGKSDDLDSTIEKTASEEGHLKKPDNVYEAAKKENINASEDSSIEATNDILKSAKIRNSETVKISETFEDNAKDTSVEIVNSDETEDPEPVKTVGTCKDTVEDAIIKERDEASSATTVEESENIIQTCRDAEIVTSLTTEEPEDSEVISQECRDAEIVDSEKAEEFNAVETTGICKATTEGARDVGTGGTNSATPTEEAAISGVEGIEAEVVHLEKIKALEAVNATEACEDVTEVNEGTKVNFALSTEGSEIIGQDNTEELEDVGTAEICSDTTKGANIEDSEKAYLTISEESEISTQVKISEKLVATSFDIEDATKTPETDDIAEEKSSRHASSENLQSHTALIAPSDVASPDNEYLSASTGNFEEAAHVKDCDDVGNSVSKDSSTVIEVPDKGGSSTLTKLGNTTKNTYIESVECDIEKANVDSIQSAINENICDEELAAVSSVAEKGTEFVKNTLHVDEVLVENKSPKSNTDLTIAETITIQVEESEEEMETLALEPDEDALSPAVENKKSPLVEQLSQEKATVVVLESLDSADSLACLQSKTNVSGEFSQDNRIFESNATGLKETTNTEDIQVPNSDVSTIESVEKQENDVVSKDSCSTDVISIPEAEILTSEVVMQPLDTSETVFVKEKETKKISERPKRGKRALAESKLEELSINVDIPEKDKPYSPKVTIKPIKVPEEDISTTGNSDPETNKCSLKMTITKQSDNTHSILKICDQERASPEPVSDEGHIPKLKIKSIVQSSEQHSPKMKNKHHSPTGSTQRCSSPRVTIKPVVKPEASPLKIKIGLKGEESLKRSSPKMKAITDEEIKDSVLSPKRTKLATKGMEEIEQVHSPRITIKPIFKPESDVTKSVAKSSNVQDDDMQERSSPKITIKPLVKPHEMEETAEEVEEDNKKRIVLKINKGTLPTTTKDDKSEKLAKITVKFSKEGGVHIVQSEESQKRLSDEAQPEKNKKQKTDDKTRHSSESPMETRSKHKDQEHLEVAKTKPTEVAVKHKDPIKDHPIEAKRSKLSPLSANEVRTRQKRKDEDVEGKVTDTKLISPIVISEDSRSQDSRNYHILEESKETSVVSSNASFETSATQDIPAVTPVAKKRGRPRKNAKEASPVVATPAVKPTDAAPVQALYESGRPKRSCRSQSARDALGIKPKKPRAQTSGSRGGGRGGKRAGETRAAPQVTSTSGEPDAYLTENIPIDNSKPLEPTTSDDVFDVKNQGVQVPTIAHKTEQKKSQKSLRDEKKVSVAFQKVHIEPQRQRRATQGKFQHKDSKAEHKKQPKELREEVHVHDVPQNQKIEQQKNLEVFHEEKKAPDLNEKYQTALTKDLKIKAIEEGTVILHGDPEIEEQKHLKSPQDEKKVPLIQQAGRQPLDASEKERSRFNPLHKARKSFIPSRPLKIEEIIDLDSDPLKVSEFPTNIEVKPVEVFKPQPIRKSRRGLGSRASSGDKQRDEVAVCEENVPTPSFTLVRPSSSGTLPSTKPSPERIAPEKLVCEKFVREKATSEKVTREKHTLNKSTEDTLTPEKLTVVKSEVEELKCGKSVSDSEKTIKGLAQFGPINITPVKHVKTVASQSSPDTAVPKEVAPEEAISQKTLPEITLEKVITKNIAAEKTVPKSTSIDNVKSEEVVQAPQKPIPEIVTSTISQAISERSTNLKVTTEKITSQKAAPEKETLEKLIQAKTALEKATFENVVLEKTTVQEVMQNRSSTEKQMLEKPKDTTEVPHANPVSEKEVIVLDKTVTIPSSITPVVSAPPTLVPSREIMEAPPTPGASGQVVSASSSADVVMLDEETRMSADTHSRAQTPAKQVVSETIAIEESQSSHHSTGTTESSSNRTTTNPSTATRAVKSNRLEVLESDARVVEPDLLTEYHWKGEGPFMLQEQVAQFLGIKSFKRKYPGITRRALDMQEKDYIRESGIASDHLLNMGLTAVNSADILDIMYSDFQDKYEEYCKYQRDRQAKELISKQKALCLATSHEKSKADITDQAMQSAAQWNVTFNKTRREQRRTCMDLQTWTVHYPKGKMKQINKPKIGNYPVALVPGQFVDYYKEFTPTEINNFPLNTMLYDEINIKHSEESGDSGSDSDSDSGSESSSSSSDSDSSSGVDDCNLCKTNQRKVASPTK